MSDAGLRRQAAARRCLTDLELDGLVVTSLPNVRYLTGFTGTSALVLVSERSTLLVTDFRYASQAAAEVGASAEVRVEPSDIWEGLREAIGAIGARRIGVERDHLTLGQARELERLEGLEMVGTADCIERLRMAKDDAEVAAIRDAASLALGALDAVLGFIAPGRSEIEIAAELEAGLRRRGSEWFPFPPIVASGPRSALPHARPGDRVVERGDLLVLDFGAQVGGYCSDITRTFVVGARADGRQREVYEVVRRAQARARLELRAGMTGRDADALARDVIAGAGMAAAFGHSLGHGIGLEVHEAPRLSRRNEAELVPGAVVTVEPGAYFEGWGGVRIEDDVVLRADGNECLSGGSTELIELT